MNVQESTKLKILRSAKDKFSKKGFAGTRLNEIAKGAKVNSALIHYYFKNKERLYIEVLKNIFGADEEIQTLQFPEA